MLSRRFQGRKVTSSLEMVLAEDDDQEGHLLKNFILQTQLDMWNMFC